MHVCRYLDAAEAAVEVAVTSGTIEIAIGVDATVHSSTDPLMGAADDDTDGTNLGGWGGLNSHVTIHCRAASWVDGVPHVTHEPVTTEKNHLKPVLVSVAVNVSGAPSTSTRVTVDVIDATGAVVTSCTVLAPRAGVVVCNCTVPQAMLWDPETPTLYTARVAVVGASDSVDDEVETRFGIRTVTRDGPRFLINGRPLFLPGYGDDAVYVTLDVVVCHHHHHHRHLRRCRHPFFLQSLPRPPPRSLSTITTMLVSSPQPPHPPSPLLLLEVSRTPSLSPPRR
jgi:hypothetical protein